MPQGAGSATAAASPPGTEKLCRTCKKPLPEQAKKCTACNSFQDWRRHLSFSTEVLALLIALLSVLGVAVPEFTKWLNRHSRTQVRVIGASEGDLLVVVMNTGREPSTAHRFRASFRNVPLGDADLFPVDPREFHIPAEDSRMVRLRPRQFTPETASDVNDVSSALPSGTLKLFAEIKESSDTRPAAITQRSTEYPTAHLSSWITNYTLPRIE